MNQNEEEYLKPIGLEENLMSRLSNSWYVTVDRDSKETKVSIENLSVEELKEWWDGNIAKDEKDEDLVKFIAISYALDRVRAYQQFLEVEGYVHV